MLLVCLCALCSLVKWKQWKEQIRRTRKDRERAGRTNKKIKIITTRKQLPCRFLPPNNYFMSRKQNRLNRCSMWSRHKPSACDEYDSTNNNMRKLSILCHFRCFDSLILSFRTVDLEPVYMNVSECVLGLHEFFQTFKILCKLCLSITVPCFPSHTFRCVSVLGLVFIGYLFQRLVRTSPFLSLTLSLFILLFNICSTKY